MHQRSTHPWPPQVAVLPLRARRIQTLQMRVVREVAVDSRGAAGDVALRPIISCRSRFQHSPPQPLTRPPRRRPALRASLGGGAEVVAACRTAASQLATMRADRPCGPGYRQYACDRDEKPRGKDHTPERSDVRVHDLPIARGEPADPTESCWRHENAVQIGQDVRRRAGRAVRRQDPDCHYSPINEPEQGADAY